MVTCLSYPLSLSTLSFLPQFEIEQQTYSLVVASILDSRRRKRLQGYAGVIASLLWWGDAIFDGKAPNVKWKIEK
jgi:hypothetical protein